MAVQAGVTNGREMALPPLVTPSSSSRALMINRKTFVNLEKAWNDKHLLGGRQRERGGGGEEGVTGESVVSLSGIKFPVKK